MRRGLAWLLNLRPLQLAVLAALLCAPSLRNGLQVDDHLLRWKVAQGADPLRVFQMEAAATARARAQGAFAWWSSPQLDGSFLRPLASATHAIEFTFWPDAAWAMHLVNVALYALAVWLAARLYRSLLPDPRIAGIAALLFAIDDAHAIPTGWISARNTLLALVFALAALSLQLHAQRTQRALPVLGSALCTALALASGEAGVWALTLLVGHALFFEAGSWSARLYRIAPQLAIGALWAAFYATHGFGAHGTSMYRDTQQLDSLVQGVLDLPLWLTTLLGPSVVGLNILLPENVARLYALPVALLFGAAVVPAIIASQSARSFALLGLLSLAPLIFTLPSDRVTSGVSFGVFGVIACAIGDSGAGFWAGSRRFALIGVHGVLSLLMFSGALRSLSSMERTRELLAAQQLAAQDVVLVRAPVELTNMYVYASLRARGEAVPTSLHTLYTGGSALALERIDASTFELSAARGWGYTPIERIFCARGELPKTGEARHLPRFRAEVLASTGSGAPQRVRFTLPEAERRRWLIWTEAGIQPFELPAIGASAQLPALNVLRAIAPK